MSRAKVSEAKPLVWRAMSVPMAVTFSVVALACVYFGVLYLIAR